MHATYPTYLILLDMIILIMFGEVYAHYAALLQLPTTSSFLSSNILLSTSFSNTLNLCSSLLVRDKFHTHTK